MMWRFARIFTDDQWHISLQMLAGSQQVAIWIGPAQEADSYKVGDFLELGVGSWHGSWARSKSPRSLSKIWRFCMIPQCADAWGIVGHVSGIWTFAESGMVWVSSVAPGFIVRWPLLPQACSLLWPVVPFAGSLACNRRCGCQQSWIDCSKQRKQGPVSSAICVDISTMMVCFLGSICGSDPSRVLRCHWAANNYCDPYQETSWWQRHWPSAAVTKVSCSPPSVAVLWENITLRRVQAPWLRSGCWGWPSEIGGTMETPKALRFLLRGGK